MSHVPKEDFMDSTLKGLSYWKTKEDNRLVNDEETTANLKSEGKKEYWKHTHATYMVNAVRERLLELFCD